MNTDNTATTWRDLADQLTTVQIQQLTDGERHTSTTELLDVARDFAGHNLLQITHADVPVPAGATGAKIWWQDSTGTSRTIHGGQWTAGNAVVAISGDQDATGAATWQIEIYPPDDTVRGLTAADARELVQVLAVAAAKLDQLDGTAPPFV